MIADMQIGTIKMIEAECIVEGNDCSMCAYAFTKVGDIDDRLCRKHNVYVGAFDICDCFENWAEATEEGREFRAAIQRIYKFSR